MYQLTALKSLHIERCNQLESIDALVNMPSLNQFSLYECNALTAIPPLFNTNMEMKDVRLEFMRSLTRLDGLAGLPKLNSIFIRALHEDVSFPTDLSRSTSITWICIETPIKDLSPIHDLSELKHLRIMYSMDTLPESLFTNKNLEKLEIYQSRITDASPLERLEFLKDLRLKHNKQLEVLPDLKKFKHLETSDIRLN
jgi:Leucine-rich repeat (LRR) protein